MLVSKNRNYTGMIKNIINLMMQLYIKLYKIDS